MAASRQRLKGRFCYAFAMVVMAAQGPGRVQ